MGDETGYLLVLNVGSSSLKASAYEIGPAGPVPWGHASVADSSGGPELITQLADGGQRATSRLSRGTAHDLVAGADAVWGWLDRAGIVSGIAAVGHRIVHGGDRFLAHRHLTPDALAHLETLEHLAPLHQRAALTVARHAMLKAPSVLHVACFDTAFHQTQPALATTYALPRRFTRAGIRRYGFHGLSYESIAGQLAVIDPQGRCGKVIVAHLGAGCSMCAMEKGISIATTMGFSTLDGLMMATRSGTIDPGVLLHLMDRYGMARRELEDLLYHHSGLLGVSGLYGDMRRLLASNDRHSREAIDLFVYRVQREIGSLAAALGGLDALVFTGGIGTGAAEIRQRIADASAWMGIHIDPTANVGDSALISPSGKAIKVWRLTTDENQVIAAHTYSRLAGRK